MAAWPRINATPRTLNMTGIRTREILVDVPRVKRKASYVSALEIVAPPKCAQVEFEVQEDKWPEASSQQIFLLSIKEK